MPVLRGRSTDGWGHRAGVGWLAFLWWLIGSAAVVHAAGSPAPELRFGDAEFVAANASTPPQTGWQPQALPDAWIHSRSGFRGIGWYRLPFRIETEIPQDLALLVGRASGIAQFWLNGSVLNPEVRFTTPERVGTDTLRSQLIPLPAGLLRVGENVLHVRLQGSGLGGDGLWDVRIGPADALRGPWLLRHLPQRVIPEAIFALMLAGSLFALFVWWRDRRVRNLHFAIVTVLWTVIMGLYVLPGLPLPQKALTVLISTVLVLFYWALLGLFYRYSGSQWRWYPRLLNVVSAITLILVLGLTLFGFDETPEHFSERMGLVLLPTVLLRALATVMLLQAAWRQRSLRSSALAAAELIWYAGHVQMIGILAGWWSPEPFRFDPSVSLPLYVVLISFFVQRLVLDREHAAREKQAAIDAERARLLHDMHDGMGAHLITALRLARTEGVDRAVVAETIEEALSDLRLIVDSLDIGNQGLVQLLGNLRFRLEPRLGMLGIRLHWEVEPLDELAHVKPEMALNVLRIVQEALNNAVKHARPRVITISVQRRNPDIVISVADDGVGFESDETTPHGRGLTSMRRRAEKLGGSFRITHREGGGTIAALQLPQARPATH